MEKKTRKNARSGRTICPDPPARAAHLPTAQNRQGGCSTAGATTREQLTLRDGRCVNQTAIRQILTTASTGRGEGSSSPTAGAARTDERRLRRSRGAVASHEQLRSELANKTSRPSSRPSHPPEDWPIGLVRWALIDGMGNAPTRRLSPSVLPPGHAAAGAPVARMAIAGAVV